jgi:hypothetical protein
MVGVGGGCCGLKCCGAGMQNEKEKEIIVGISLVETEIYT